MNPEYRDLFGEIMESLRRSTAEGERAGVRQMIIDPGIGFGKNQTDNLRLIAGLGRFAALGYPILVGPSRKSFIGNILNLPVDDRVEGTLAGVVACILNGAHLVRVHDVRQVQRVAAVADAIRRTSPPVLS
jgi:dihydropteroate synthase